MTNSFVSLIYVYITVLCNLCTHHSASEGFPYSFVPQALQWSSGHKKQNSFLYQQDHARVFSLKGKQMVKFSDSGLLWELRSSWNRLASPESCDTPRSTLYFWSFKASKRDLKNHTGDRVTCSLNASILLFSSQQAERFKHPQWASSTWLHFAVRSFSSSRHFGSAQTSSLPPPLKSYYLLQKFLCQPPLTALDLVPPHWGLLSDSNHKNLL